VQVAREGFASIRHVASGEVMHARTPPMVEAERLYVDQSGLAGRLRLGPGEKASEAPPLVVWDVGLGAGANAMAAIRCYEQTAAHHAVRALEIVSFEADLDPLRLAFAHRHHFPYLRHGAPAGILGSGRWRSSAGGGLGWRLVEGDFFETLPDVLPRPDLVFYDLFSARTHAEAWTLSSFRRLFGAFGARDAELFTYTASTAARVAMLGAGFLVATGRATDDKPESTIAFTPRARDHGSARRHDLLGADWLARWKRSGARYPSDLPAADQGEFEAAILRHEQFRAIGHGTQI
jgi:queuine tRNA-ribosyltransferase